MSHAEQETRPLLLHAAPFWQRMICRRLSGLTHGRLTLVFPAGRNMCCKARSPDRMGSFA